MTPKKFERAKKKSLAKWSVNFENVQEASNWWIRVGSERCSFCDIFGASICNYCITTWDCGQCPLVPPNLRSCCVEWETIEASYINDDTDFMDVLNTQAKLLYKKIEAIQYNPEWKSI